MIGAGEVLLGIAIATRLYRKLLASIRILDHQHEYYRIQLRYRQPSLGTAKHNLCSNILLCRFHWNGYILNKHADVESN